MMYNFSNAKIHFFSMSSIFFNKDPKKCTIFASFALNKTKESPLGMELVMCLKGGGMWILRKVNATSRHSKQHKRFSLPVRNLQH